MSVSGRSAAWFWHFPCDCSGVGFCISSPASRSYTFVSIPLSGATVQRQVLPPPRGELALVAVVAPASALETVCLLPVSIGASSAVTGAQS
eukprot:5042795-Lingulodinium_polyedra.AAC.1